MKTFRFIAENAAQALTQINARLGPDAVVLSVRKIPANGLARLWQSAGKVEVIAGLSGNDRPNEYSATFPGSAGDVEPPAEFNIAASSPRWPTVAWLETMGLLPDYAQRLQSHLNAVHGDAAPNSLEAQWTAVSSTLNSFWREPLRLDDGRARPHVFIGPAGAGKTTVLCKWLTLAVLTEEKRARVWRLDGPTANTAEFLGIHCEMLGTPTERFWTAPPQAADADLLFVDLPGIEFRDAAAMEGLRSQLATLPAPRVHLVLNAAYETSSLLAQWRAFAALNPEDLIFTHLDEESRRVKLWNFVFGTNCSLRFLSAGQKIPGEFLHAAPGLLFPP